MIRARRLVPLATAALALAGCAPFPDRDPLWTGPPPGTINRDDTVQPRSDWPPARQGDAANCALPPIVADGQAIAVGLYESATLSSAAVGGLDQETLFVTVRIEPDPTTPAPAPSGFDQSMWSEAARYWPGGIKSVSPGLIVSAASVRSYRVLPSQAGLSELIGEGAIVGSCIVKPIAHLPPRMTGAHRADLILAAGIPVPPGELGHASLNIPQAGELDRDRAQRRP